MFSLEIVEIIKNGSAVAFNGLLFIPSSVEGSHRVQKFNWGTHNRAGLFSPLCSLDDFGKIWSACGQHEI
jgi:hypothetical protein